MTIVAALLAAAVSGAATAFTVRSLIPQMPLRRPNYRGVPIPTGLGLAQVAGFAAGAGLLALMQTIWPGAAERGSWLLPLAAAGGFAALGALDDVMSTLAHPPEHGFRLHVTALMHGRMTTGGFKLIAGSILAFAISASVTQGFGIALAGGAVIALCANLLNCFDVRPGRAGKAFLLGAVPLAFLGGPLRGTVFAAIGCVAAFLPFDLKERAMSGDSGSNALGAALGTCVVLVSSRGTLIIVLLGLIALQILAEGPTLSRMIDAFPPLRAADRWGRTPETTLPVEKEMQSS